MRTYQATRGPLPAAGGDTRDWVFGLLGNARHRRRLEALAALDIARRPACEPSLRALVTDDWDHDTLYHVGWCQSCRAAALALGMTTGSGARSPHRRHALYVVLAAAVAIAAPLAGSDLLNRDGGHTVAQSGGSRTTPATTTPGTTSTTPATTPAQTTTAPAVTPVPRAKHPRKHAAPAKHVKRALPLTT
jgi:hypothetical protein